MVIVTWFGSYFHTAVYKDHSLVVIDRVRFVSDDDTTWLVKCMTRVCSEDFGESAAAFVEPNLTFVDFLRYR